MNDKVSKTVKRKSFDEYISDAKKWHDQGQYSKAIDSYLQALTIKPDSWSVLNQLGKTYEANDQYGRAVDCYQQVAALQPNNIWTLRRLGKALAHRKKFSAASDAFSQAIKTNPDCPASIYVDLADALLKSGYPKNAIAAYQQALDHKPSDRAAIQQKIYRAIKVEGQGPLGNIARRIDNEEIYSGGPVQLFEKIGRETIITLLQNGLRPDHKVLDFGCGALRLGYWIVRLIDRGNYYGIEPKLSMLETGKKHSLGRELIKSKAPQFSTNSDCDFSVFGVSFDYVVARSIFTHMTPALLRDSLKSFRDNSSAEGIMLATYWDHDFPTPGELGEELLLTDARFIHVIKYNFETIKAWAEEFELKVSEYRVNPIFNHQIWLKFERTGAPISDYLG